MSEKVISKLHIFLFRLVITDWMPDLATSCHSVLALFWSSRTMRNIRLLYSDTMCSLDRRFPALSFPSGSRQHFYDVFVYLLVWLWLWLWYCCQHNLHSYFFAFLVRLGTLKFTMLLCSKCELLLIAIVRHIYWSQTLNICFNNFKTRDCPIIVRNFGYIFSY